MLEREFGGHRLLHCFIDAKYRTDEVYNFCRAYRAYPIRGEGRRTRPYDWATIDRMPDGTAIPGGLRLLHINGEYWREALFHKFAIKPGDPGYWSLHGETGVDYALQMIAEVLIEKKDRKGRIKRHWKQVRRDNHYLDCELMQLAVAAVIGVRYAQAPAKSETPAENPLPDMRKDSWKPTRFKV